MEKAFYMNDLLIGLAFVALLLAPAVAATIQRSGSGEDDDKH